MSYVSVILCMYESGLDRAGCNSVVLGSVHHIAYNQPVSRTLRGYVCISYHIFCGYWSGCWSIGPSFSFVSPLAPNELSNPSRCSRMPSNLSSTPSAIPLAASSRCISSSTSSIPNSSFSPPSTASGSSGLSPFVEVVVVEEISDASVEMSASREEVWFGWSGVFLSEDIGDWGEARDDEGVAIVRNIKFRLLFSCVTLITFSNQSFLRLWRSLSGPPSERWRSRRKNYRPL